MHANALTGGFADPALEAAQVFRAALQALARPGRIEPLAGARAPAPASPAAAALILTLCDGETPLHLAGAHDTPDMRDWIAFHTGAPVVAREASMFALGTWQALQPLDGFRIGTPEYPDRAATLIVELDRLAPEGPRLTGPGIRDVAHLALPEVAAFRSNHTRFPLGLDFFFTCGHRIAGLPRSTNVEDG